jgi:hypothetical protein
VSADIQEAARGLRRCLNRKDAAAYMGVCVKTFDEIRHLFAVSVAGNIRYDVVLMDKYIDLHRVLAA